MNPGNQMASSSTQIECTTEAIEVIDPETGRFLDMNEQGCRNLGYSREEILSLTLSDIEPAVDFAVLLDRIEELRRTGSTNLETVRRRKDGITFPARVSLMLTRLDREYVVGIVRDITESNRGEESSDHERDLLRTVIDLLPDHIYVKDAGSRFLLANISVAQAMGVDNPEKLIGKTDRDFYPEKESNEFQGDEQDVLNGHAMFNKEEPVSHPDGARRFILTTKVPIKSTDGNIIGLVGIGRDITARKRAEAELQHSLSLLTATLESTADGLLALDIEGNVVSFNQRFINLWRIPAEIAASPDKNQVLTFATGQLQNTDAFLNKVHKSPAPSESTNSGMLNFKDGRLFEHYSHPQLLDGQTVGWVWSFRDVTERRRLEDQLRQFQKMETVGQLAAGIAHDFNNILTVIQGYSDLLRMQLADRPKAAESVEQIASAGERAANLTRQLLLFSRKQVPLRHLCDLNELTGNLTKMLGRILGEDIDLRLEFRPDLPPVHADPGMIEQIITNLSVNARDAMPEGGRLEIATSVVDLDASRLRSNPEAKPGRFVCLEVCDTGSGIEPENLPKIFEPFFTTKEIGKGTGLGLATVYGIVIQHQGVIEVSSQPGKGTRFHIFFPAALHEKDIATSTPEPASARSSGETILLVEDDIVVLLLVEKSLSKAGYNVLIASSGAAALEVWQEHRDKIDLLLTDMVMPGIYSGKRLANSLKLEKPALRVIFMSGYSPDLQSGDLDIKEGFNFIQKPFSQSMLLQTVRRQLDARV